MVTSAGLFLVPQAVGFDPRVGGLGVAAGILTGFGAHVGGHRLAHVGYGFDDTAVQLSAHALSAGVPTAVLAVPGTDAMNALVFGFAAGIFLHIAMDFLPRCEVGGEVGEVAQLSADAHDLLDRLRVHAVLSTTLGGVVVALAWLGV